MPKSFPILIRWTELNRDFSLFYFSFGVVAEGKIKTLVRTLQQTPRHR